MLGDLTVTIVEGPDEYLFGEEKALLEVIEGREPLPRLLPPWQHGLFATAPSGGWEAEAVSSRGDSNPTVVNNVETLATAAHVLARGADWFRTMGTVASPGTIIATVVGDVRHPGVHEVELGTPLSQPARRAAVVLPRAVAGGRRCPGCRTRCCPRPTSTSPHLRGPRGAWVRPGGRRLRGVRRQRRHAQRGPRAVAVPGRRVVRPVPTVQERLHADHRPAARHRGGPRERLRPR